MTLGQCCVYCLGLSICNLDVFLFYKTKQWYNPQYSAMRQNQGHRITFNVSCVILLSGACLFYITHLFWCQLQI